MLFCANGLLWLITICAKQEVCRILPLAPLDAVNLFLDFQ